ncbi:hypothetical protein FLM48_08340 [Shewanella sp. Scap07]|uniref:hypothetical protein n=1 Tax=Shewanella sp. Scap07 TaxID=2589987 RepID=UPI0015BC5A5E|nr:hypothetical protein [Shewanella sp. Scap07]QLE85100.1 hypothetical protein FLM48_08340 [Shewanella sp. Scap07]
MRFICYRLGLFCQQTAAELNLYLLQLVSIGCSLLSGWPFNDVANAKGPLPKEYGQGPLHGS